MARTKKATEAPIDRLDAMLARLQLSGIRDQLDNLLDEAARANLSARETLMLLCEREIARKDHRRIEMALKLAHFPAVKELAGFDFEAHLAKWEREVANMRIHGTTGEAPIARFARDEAHRLKPLGGQPSFGSLRELARVVGNDCAVEIDTNSYSVPWQLIGERVAVTVAAGEVRIRHGMREVAVHKQSEGRRLRIVDSAHLDGVAGRNGAVCRPEIVAVAVPGSSPPPSLLRPLAEYEAVVGGSF